MPGVNYVYMVTSLREQIQELFPLEENVVTVITKDRVMMTILKGNIKTKLCVPVNYFY